MPVFKYRDPETGDWVSVGGGGGTSSEGYTKEEVDSKFATKEETYNREEVDGALEKKADLVDGKVPAEQLPEISVDTYSKEEVLSDATKIMYGLNSDATPNTIFQKLIMPNGYYGYELTVIFEDGTPVPNVILNGLKDFYDNIPVTDSEGHGYGVSENSSLVVSISDYIGVVAKDETISAQDGYVFTPVTIVLERDAEIHLIQESKQLRVLTGIPIDMCIVGGGAGGRYFTTESYTASPGGGGGYVTNILDVTLNTPEISLVVGAGGAVNANGGTTSIKYNDITETANGGSGTTGNGNGSYGVGGDGTVYVFNDESLPRPGGGGGGGQRSVSTAYAGGADFGGNGAVYSGTYAGAGRGPGGGGGGGYTQSVNGTYGHSGAAGAAGGLYIRVNHGSEVLV